MSPNAQRQERAVSQAGHDNIGLRYRDPQAGDVVIFHPDFAVSNSPSWFNDDVFIKRIVATAGDTVEVPPLFNLGTLVAFVDTPTVLPERQLQSLLL